MKWSRYDKWALHRALREKKKSLGLTSGEPGPFPHNPEDELVAWLGFLGQFKIEMVERYEVGDVWTITLEPRGVLGVELAGTCGRRGKRARSKEHVIVEDPFFPLHLHKGLKIPKNIAEKFLVLGIP